MICELPPFKGFAGSLFTERLARITSRGFYRGAGIKWRPGWSTKGAQWRQALPQQPSHHASRDWPAKQNHEKPQRAASKAAALEAGSHAVSSRQGLPQNVRYLRLHTVNYAITVRDNLVLSSITSRS